MTYLSAPTPSDTFKAGMSDLDKAATMLLGVVDSLRIQSHWANEGVRDHGDEYAQDASTKATVKRTINDATLDMARAQRLMSDALLAVGMA